MHLFQLRERGEMWFGYIGQLEVVNGGLLPNGRFAPARTALSHLPKRKTEIMLISYWDVCFALMY